MLPKHVDPWLISMRLEFGWTAQQIADDADETVAMLVHLLAVHGCPDLSVRLAKSSLLQRYGSETL